MILQVMNDEFEVNVEDGSAWEVAVGIMRLRKECGEGRFGGVDELWERWVEKGGKGVEGVFRKVEVPEGEEEWDSEEDGEEDGEGEDVDMEEAPALVETKEKIVREVDDEGFTKVVGKKRR